MGERVRAPKIFIDYRRDLSRAVALSYPQAEPVVSSRHHLSLSPLYRHQRDTRSALLRRAPNGKSGRSYNLAVGCSRLPVASGERRFLRLRAREGLAAQGD